MKFYQQNRLFSVESSTKVTYGEYIDDKERRCFKGDVWIKDKEHKKEAVWLQGRQPVV